MNIATDRDPVSDWPPAWRALIGRLNTAGGVTWRPLSPSLPD